MIQNLETTLKSGGVPQVPQFRPSTVNPSLSASANTPKNPSVPNTSTTKEVRGKEDSSSQKTATAVSPSPSAKPSSDNAVTAADPLGDARNKVQDEIIKEFAAIMATGTMRASEAATLATRRVMQRYGQISVSQS